ncbi:MAG: zinc ribbon domain-containing protein [Candidatus Omnitrophica bacterium]|nr:zinc ribbon domain-containing protein [Candidatus Omnitrophota bacterium]HOX55236.1 zinc ribbon domain-containing protein [Candidatus Omnitrophota bacterium]
MPTYEYECLNCGHNFEIFQNMTEEPIKKCPKCKKLKLKRLIGSGAGIIFKGSGFYATDYKKSKEGKSKSDKTCHSCPSSNCPHGNK